MPAWWANRAKPTTNRPQIVGVLDLVLGEDPHLSRVTPRDERIARFGEESLELRCQLLANVVQRRVARDQTGCLEHEHLRHQRAKSGRGQQCAVELADSHLADHSLLVARDTPMIHLQLDRAVRDLAKLLSQGLKCPAKARLSRSEGCEANLVGRRRRFRRGTPLTHGARTGPRPPRS